MNELPPVLSVLLGTAAMSSEIFHRVRDRAHAPRV